MVSHLSYILFFTQESSTLTNRTIHIKNVPAGYVFAVLFKYPFLD